MTAPVSGAQVDDGSPARPARAGRRARAGADLSVTKVQGANVADQIASQMITRIVEDDLEPRSPLPTESELSAAFGVGKSTIREAVRIVATKGLVEVAHGSGMRVAPRERWNVIDPQLVALMARDVTIGQLLEMRAILEPEIAAHAAERATSDDFDQMERIIVASEAASRRPADYLRLDLAFHDALAVAAHNAIYPIVMTSVSDLLIECRRRAAMDARQRVGGATDHRSLLEAVRTRDPDLARDRMAAHIASVAAWHREHPLE
jgi:GntR family transcriptional repressor for pyruvate dehydrogenase complex